jgi:hypothetical protein
MKPAIGAPIAKASTAAINSLLVFIDETASRRALMMSAARARRAPKFGFMRAAI